MAFRSLLVPGFRAFSCPHRGIFFRDGVGISRKVMPGVLAVLRERLSFSNLHITHLFAAWAAADSKYFTFVHRSGIDSNRSQPKSGDDIFYLPNLHVHKNGINKRRDKTAPESYSTKDIVPIYRDNEADSKDHRQHNEKDKKKSKEFQSVHINTNLTH